MNDTTLLAVTLLVMGVLFVTTAGVVWHTRRSRVAVMTVAGLGVCTLLIIAAHGLRPLLDEPVRFVAERVEALALAGAVVMVLVSLRENR